jgi:hypothetical protein
MAIRGSKEENFQIKGSINEVVEKCLTALQKGGFKKIKFNETINQFEADYKPSIIFTTVYGSIKITLTENNSFSNVDNKNLVNVNVISTANIDNIYALFSSPNDKILSYFKNNL